MAQSNIVPQPEQTPAPLETLSAEELTRAGDLLSKSLLFTLRRNYLSNPLIKNGYVRLQDKDIPEQTDVAFMELEQVGKPIEEDANKYFKAMQTALAACHDPRYSLLFIISSDGLRSRIYFGVVAREGGTQPKIFAEQLGEFLCSNWPGTRVKAVDDYKLVSTFFHGPLSKYRHAHCFTGIPSSKSKESDKDYPQSLDQFMRGLRNKPYVYIVIADPINEGRVVDLISSCRSLSGQVHAFAKTTIQKSRSEGTSSTESTSTSESTSDSKTTGTSKSTTKGGGKGVLGTMMEKGGKLKKGFKSLGVVGLGGALAAIGGPFLLTGMLGMFGQLLPSSSSSETIGGSESLGTTLGTSTSSSDSTGTTSSESMSFGREYLNKHAEACEKLLDETITRFELARGQGCWDVGVYLVCDQMETAAQGQAQLKALVSGQKSSFEPVRSHDLVPLWDDKVQTYLDAFQHPPLVLNSPEDNSIINHPLGNVFASLTTPLNTEELALFANLPLREIPGIPLQPTAYFSLNPPEVKDEKKALSIGHVLEGGESIGVLKYEVDVDTLTRHVFITGVTGSGKSNTCRRLIAEMMERDINFMVIEPAKDEYVQMALAYNQAGTFKKKIAVYMLGRKEWGGMPLEELKLNPFDIIQLPGANTQVMPHIDRLKSIFNASFPMQEILPLILEEALVELYDSQGWLEDELPPAEYDRPTMQQLYDRTTTLVQDRGYEERITSNITAAMKTRIGSLLRGWKRKTFNHPHSVPWADLFDRPLIINLQNLGDDADKCFTMALLFNFLYEYRQAQHEAAGSPESSDLHHLTIIEEAHRILRASGQGAGAEGMHPQAKMGEMFADILAEIRVYGEGLGIIDQVPAKLIPDALKNTNLKIIHRLVASDDREAMAKALALKEEQAEVIARLKVGQAIVSGIQDDMASWVKVQYTPLPKFTHKKKVSKSKK